MHCACYFGMTAEEKRCYACEHYHQAGRKDGSGESDGDGRIVVKLRVEVGQPL